MKKILSTMLVFLVIFGLVACAAPAATTTTAEEPAATEAAAATEATEAPAAEAATPVDLGDPTTVLSTDDQILMPALTVKDFPRVPRIRKRCRKTMPTTIMTSSSPVGMQARR